MLLSIMGVSCLQQPGEKHLKMWMLGKEGPASIRALVGLESLLFTVRRPSPTPRLSAPSFLPAQGQQARCGPMEEPGAFWELEGGSPSPPGNSGQQSGVQPSILCQGLRWPAPPPPAACGHGLDTA